MATNHETGVQIFSGGPVKEGGLKLQKGKEYSLGDIQIAICGECDGDIAWYGCGTQAFHNGPFSTQMGVCVKCGEKYIYSNSQKVKIY